jgi:iron complex outermembrane receptor protein
MELDQRHFLFVSLLAAASCGAAPAVAQEAAAAENKAARESQAELPAQHIVGRRQSGQYNAGSSAGATKTDTPLIEVPQAVRVMTRQLVDDLSAQRLDDVLDYAAGVSRQNNFGGTWDNVAIRGFAGHEDSTMSMLRNGMPANRGFNAPRDTANLEQIEFLKGTMGALYGSSEPGGTLNLVTKQPRFSSGHSVEAYVGSHNYKRMALDSTGPLNGGDGAAPTLAYRLNASVEDKDSFRDEVHSRRTLLAPALTWNVTPDTQLRYDGEWLRQAAPLDRGVVVVNGQIDAVPTSRFYGETNVGDTTIDNHTHQFFAEHTVNEQWSLYGGLQLKRGTLEGFGIEQVPFGGPDCATSMNTRDWLCRRLRYRDFESRETSVQFEARGRLSTGDVKHELMVGVEAARFTQGRTMLDHAGGLRNGLGISVSNPVYGQVAYPALSPLNASRNGTLKDNTRALYVQDVASLTNSLKLLAGLRHDRATSRNTSINGSSSEQDPGATSPRLGLTWMIQPTLSAYASTGRSFRANTDRDTAGHFFAPQKGKAHEAGLKWESQDGRLSSNVAVFDITKTNVPTDLDPNTELYGSAMTVHNKGVEFELAGWVAKGWRAALSYVYLDTDPKVKQFARHSGSAFLVHETTLASGNLVGLGGGVTHVGARQGDSDGQWGDTPVQLPSYTVAKLTAYWNATRQLRVSLDVDNLFDKTYYASAYNSVWVAPGAPRTVIAGVQYKF